MGSGSFLGKVSKERQEGPFGGGKVRVWVKKEKTGNWSGLVIGNKTSAGEAKTLTSNGGRLGEGGLRIISTNGM